MYRGLILSNGLWFQNESSSWSSRSSWAWWLGGHVLVWHSASHKLVTTSARYPSHLKKMKWNNPTPAFLVTTLPCWANQANGVAGKALFFLFFIYFLLKYSWHNIMLVSGAWLSDSIFTYKHNKPEVLKYREQTGGYSGQFLKHLTTWMDFFFFAKLSDLQKSPQASTGPLCSCSGLPFVLLLCMCASFSQSCESKLQPRCLLVNTPIVISWPCRRWGDSVFSLWVCRLSIHVAHLCHWTPSAPHSWEEAVEASLSRRWWH